jgi:hypothetical protein
VGVGEPPCVATRAPAVRVATESRLGYLYVYVPLVARTWLALAMMLASTTPASAQPRFVANTPPSTQECVAAFDHGQRAQSDRALRRAQSELIVCSQESCPAVLRVDCAGVLADVLAALPTLVFAADDGHGHELTDVKVYMGNQLLAASLDGRALAVDPGTFELRFERAGEKPANVTLTIREGEKRRVVRVSLGGADPTIPLRQGARGQTAERKTLGWVLPGSLAVTSLAAFGVSLYERLHFSNRVDELRGSCAPDCTSEQRSQLSGLVVTSNVALAIGVSALTLAVVTWFATAPAPTVSPTPAAASRAAAPPLGIWAW